MNASITRRVASLEAKVAPVRTRAPIPVDVDDGRGEVQRDIYCSGAPDHQAERITLRIVAPPSQTPARPAAQPIEDALDDPAVRAVAEALRIARETPPEGAAKPKPIAKAFAKLRFDDVFPATVGKGRA